MSNEIKSSEVEGAATRTEPPCKCTGGPCYWKPDIVAVPGFVGAELYHSHKGPRLRWPGHDDYASRTEVSLINALVAREAAVKGLYDALKRIDVQGCRVIHGSYPSKTTCLDVQDFARTNKRPHRFAPEYRGKVIAGERLCDGCVARAAIASYEATLTKGE